ncbi:hypothetical protein K474DRAFT_1658886 [Panus rudis PR-1116 ss-1]|nr:hypothetical protein K474DRAFT_1658886 [Panus rudis PR-1116 ss-1]
MTLGHMTADTPAVMVADMTTSAAVAPGTKRTIVAGVTTIATETTTEEVTIVDMTVGVAMTTDATEDTRSRSTQHHTAHKQKDWFQPRLPFCCLAGFRVHASLVLLQLYC